MDRNNVKHRTDRVFDADSNGAIGINVSTLFVEIQQLKVEVSIVISCCISTYQCPIEKPIAPMKLWHFILSIRTLTSTAAFVLQENFANATLFLDSPHLLGRH